MRRWGRRAFLGLALGPAAATGWAVWVGPASVAHPYTARMPWVASLDLDLTLALSPVGWLLTLVVGGVGALVLAYCAWYFDDDEPGLGLLAGSLVTFAGAMLGLVWADNLLVLYVFWELTSVLSFLLIGHDPTKRAARQSAIQALVVTTAGGLAMLVGILLLGSRTGSYSVSALLAHPPPADTALAVAVVLLLLGALSKSAIFPFHFWLPAAMAAPTPVSAYLHAAAMVKAGAFLVALLAPALAGVPGWRVLLLPLGVGTMLLGAWRALRQFDLKLLVAHGTVSQLGMLLALLGVGSAAVVRAGLALLLSHALFKSCLFLTVGAIDRSTGTRDMRELSGLWRRLPLLFVGAAVAVGSMAGLPPMIGFVGKESMWATLLAEARGGGSGALTGWPALCLVAGLLVGSTLTVGYAARFLHGAFGAATPTTSVMQSREGSPAGTRPPVFTPAGFEPTGRPGLVAVPALLAAASFAAGFLGGPLSRALTGYVSVFPEVDAPLDPLVLWHAPGLPVLLSATAVAAGLGLFAARARVGRLQGRLALEYTAERAYTAVMRGLERLAVAVTSVTQWGSLAIYLGVALVVLVAVPGQLLLRAPWPTGTVWFDMPGQLVVIVVIVIAAVATARSRRRLRAVILLGVTGYGTAVLFLLHGAPDLALTQLLVETVSLVVFVLVLRRLPSHFTDRPLPRTRYWRILIALGTSAVVGSLLLVALAARTAPSLTEELADGAVDFGHGHNVVNVILVDVRAWDTFGEISVLVAAATGVASLVFVNTRVTTIRRIREIPLPTGVPKVATRPGRRVWLPAPRTLAPEERSIMFEVVTRILFHVMILVGLYLVLAGHNEPGGGFAGGVVVGLALTVRYLAGGRYELNEAAPVDAGVLLGGGLVVAALSALAPLAFGGHVLQSATLAFSLPLVGEVSLVTSLFFDLGVFLVVVGLVLDLLRSLGSGIDRHIRAEELERDRAVDAP